MLAREFGDTIRFTSPPRLVQRALSGLLAPVARAAGRRALDPDHVNCELPVVDLEPLPDELLLTQWTYTGGPNEAKAAGYYHDDALLEFPQSGERFRGRANIEGWRQQYPARLDFEPRRIRGGGDLWVAEAGLRYDGGDPVSVVKILQFRGGQDRARDALLRRPVPGPGLAPPLGRRRPGRRAPGRPPGPRRRGNLRSRRPG